MIKACKTCRAEFDAQRKELHCPDHRSLTKRGYRRVVVDGRHVMEHRLVMERHLGRPLVPGEVVHHRNGVRTDNRIENLEVIATHREHLVNHQQPHRYRCPGCESIFEAKPHQKRRFCSRECYAKAHRGMQFGRWSFPPAAPV